MILSKSLKLALIRMQSGVSSSDTNWRTELFDVTQDIINNGKIVLLNAPLVNTEMIKLNGLEMLNNSGWDYTVSGKEIIFGDDILLTVGDTIRVRYKI